MPQQRKTARRARWSRLSLLPLRERLFLLLVSACALGPALASLYAEAAAPTQSSALVSAGRHPTMLMLAGALIALAALVALERPRSLRPRDYAAQLRARLVQAQTQCDAEFRRRFPEEARNEVVSPER